MKKMMIGLMVLMLATLAMAETMTMSGVIKGNKGRLTGYLRVKGADRTQINLGDNVPAAMLEGLVEGDSVKVVAEVKPHHKNANQYIATEIISLEKQ